MADDARRDSVVVQAVHVASGREISWSDTLVQRLEDRVDDIREAIVAGAQAVAADAERMTLTNGWQVDEISATFGVTLTADARVLVSRAGAEATFEVTVTLRRS